MKYEQCKEILTERIETANKHLRLIEDINQGPISKELFESARLIFEEELFETKIRNNILGMIFPDATDIGSCSSGMAFKLKGQRIELPINTKKPIRIVIPSIDMKAPDIETNCEYQFVVKYAAMLENKDSWVKKANLRLSVIKPILRPLFWFFYVVPKDRKNKYNLEYCNSVKSRIELEYKELSDRYKDKIQEKINILVIIKDEVAPEILKYTSNCSISNPFEDLIPCSVDIIESLEELIESCKALL